MFVRPPRASRRPVSGGLPFRGRLFLSVTSTGAPVVGIRYGAAATNGSASVTYSSNLLQFGSIATFSITAGTDVWNFNTASLIFFGGKYYFLSQSMTINGVAFTVAGIGDVVGNSFGANMTVTAAGTTVGSLNFSATGSVTYIASGSQPPGVQVTVGSDDSLSWVSGNATFTGFPTLLGVNRNGGPNPLTGGYVGTIVGGPKAELDWEASGQGPIDDEPTPPVYPPAAE
ncbi:MAG: hypothetical protein NTV52_17795 [Acidobacteria bacterium]|nr:hypothetical protein [Acidobacteriota bacterium]